MSGACGLTERQCLQWMPGEGNLEKKRGLLIFGEGEQE